MSLATNEDAPEPENVTSNRIYEIVVVSIASAIVLVCGTLFLLMVIRRRWNMCKVPYDQYMEENTVSVINISRNSQDKISTIELDGPAHLTYFNERSKAVPSEITIGQVKLSRDALLYISLITCMNLPDDLHPEESL